MTRSNERLDKVRSVEDNAHEYSSEGAGNRDGEDPREDKEADSLPVDSLQGAVAETNTDSGTSDAHGGRHWKRELREDEDRDGSAHLHRAT